MNTFTALLRVVRLSPALPGRFARMRLHSAVTPTATVWSRPRPADFRSTPLPSPARRFLRTSPQNRFPRRAGGRHLVHAGGNYHITEAHQWDGAVLRPGGMARGGWHAGSCITVYVSLEGMPRESNKLEKFCARDGLIRIGSEPSEDGKPIPNPGCLIYA